MSRESQNLAQLLESLGFTKDPSRLTVFFAAEPSANLGQPWQIRNWTLTNSGRWTTENIDFTIAIQVLNQRLDEAFGPLWSGYKTRIDSCVRTWRLA